MSLDQFAHASATFDAKGRPQSDSVVEELQSAVTGRPNNTLLVLCHGWNNNRAQARDLYDRLLANMLEVDQVHGSGNLAQTLAVLAIHWPSKQFDLEGRNPAQDDGAANVGGNDDDAALLAALAALREPHTSATGLSAIDQAVSLVPKLTDLRSARDTFVALLLPLLTEEEDEEDPDADHSVAERASGDEPPAMLASLTGREVLDRLGRPLPPALLPAPNGGVGGGAAGNVGRGVGSGALSFVNLLTFWKMKKRAGKVGRRGLQPLLGAVHQTMPQLALHLAGHSFGARLLTAAVVAGLPLTAQQRPTVHSLSLLQGAFSHNGFAEDFHRNKDGAFRALLTESLVQGPVLATHTRNDRAVGLAYPLASRLSRDDASAVGDADDRFGGIGSNGAVHTPEAISESLLAPGQEYTLQAGRIHNLRADDHIGGHSKIDNGAVAGALLAALAH